jgi:hypothetical protein
LVIRVAAKELARERGDVGGAERLVVGGITPVRTHHGSYSVTARGGTPRA